MNKALKYGALAVFVGLGATSVAQADTATTGGGLKIKTDDGKFDASIGGRIHFDYYSLFGGDDSSGKGTSLASVEERNEFYFRRVFLSAIGHLYGFEYHFDWDFVGNQGQDIWVAHDLLPGGTIYLGQHKPWRSLDEIASNNNTPFMERNAASASNGTGGGIYSNIDYTTGLYYSWNHNLFLSGDSLWAGASVYSLHKLGSTPGTPVATTTCTTPTGTATCVTGVSGGSDTGATSGMGYNARLAWAPFVAQDKWAHIGFAYTSENPDAGGSGGYRTLAPTFDYPGGNKSPVTLVLASYAAAGGRNPHADDLAGELAGAYGPFFFQGEYVESSLHRSGAAVDNTVSVYSVGGTYAITGETRPYDKKNATYGAIKPVHTYGAVEVGLRYDGARNDKHGGAYSGCAISGGNGGTATAASKCSANQLTFGVTYYVNPAVKFILNFSHGEVDISPVGKDSSNAVISRVQLVF